MNSQSIISADIVAELAKLRAENEALKSKEQAKRDAKRNAPLTCKVSEAKGCLSVYGLGSRFPLSLYAQQWARLFDNQEVIKAFLKANEDKLTVK
jgi:hypothetical protein